VKCVKSLFQEEAAGPSKEPVDPSPSTHTLHGVKTPTGGYAKVFIPRVPKPDASLDESIDSTPPRRTVEIVARPPPIQGLPGQFEDSSDEEKEEEDTMASLRAELTALKAKFQNLEEHCAENELGRMETDDKINILRKGLSSKVRRLADATRHADLYDPPAP